MEVEKRKALEERADRYYQEWNSARNSLERSAKSYSKKIAIMVVIGLSLLFIFRFLSGSRNQKATRKSYAVSSKLGNALQSILLPIAVRVIKNLLLNDDQKELDGTPGEDL